MPPRIFFARQRGRLLAIGLLLLSADAFGLSVSIPPVQAKTGDGRLVLFSYPHKELLEVTYRKKEGTYDAAALKKIAAVMRSPDGESKPIAPDLIEWIDSLQDYFSADAVEIISGYRSPAYNKKLKENGRDVAMNSLHLEGRAADIHLDEVTEKILFELARDMHAGGVGFYPGLHFVHLDLGPARFWEDSGSAPRKVIGMEANTGPCKIITDQNFYSRTVSKILVTIEGPAECALSDEIFFEHFRRGVWKSQDKPSRLIPAAAASPKEVFYSVPLMAERPAGKYRLRAVYKGSKNLPSLSNEFYLKIE